MKIGVLFPMLLGLVLQVGKASSQEYPAFTEVLARSTFRIEGVGQAGTVVIMGEPKADAKEARFVMLTAGHVLENIRGDSATLVLRTKSQDVYRRFPFRVQVRSGGEPLWLKHPEMDIAGMYVALPREADVLLVSTNLLASDSSLRKFQIGLGSEVFVLGFPYNLESNEAGFPVLRSGRIASFPVYPTSEYKSFLVDLAAFEGNSGGPVFIMSPNPSFDGAVHVGANLQFVLGILTHKVRGTQVGQAGLREENLQLGLVAQAMHLKELIGMLKSTLSTRGNLGQ